MDLEFEPSSIAFTISGFLGALAVIYFGSAYIFQLSPAVKSLLILSVFGFMFVAAQRFSGRDRFLSLIAYGVSGTSYLVFLVYTALKFNLGQLEILLMLSSSSILFAGLGYLMNKDRMVFVEENSRELLAAILILSISLTAFDTAGAKPSYALELEESVEINQGEIEIGNLKVSNSFMLPREVNVPSYDACLFTPEMRDAYISIEEKEIIESGKTENLSVTVSAIPRRENGSLNGTYILEKAGKCPEEAEKGKIFVFPEKNLD